MCNAELRTSPEAELGLNFRTTQKRRIGFYTYYFSEVEMTWISNSFTRWAGWGPPGIDQGVETIQIRPHSGSDIESHVQYSG
jgi:hypothetical protein